MSKPKMRARLASLSFSDKIKILENFATAVLRSL